MDVTADQLTHEQRAAAEREGGPVVISGAAGTGKTTTLVARYLRLLRQLPASRVLVVCRNRPAADRFRAAVLPSLRGGFDGLPVTTVHGLALDVLLRSGRGVTLVGAGERRAIVRRLLAADRAENWPAFGHLLGQPAFAAEVEEGLRVLREAGSEASDRAECGAAWRDLAGFAGRYREELARLGVVDAPALLEEAAAVASERARFGALVVDDAEALTPLGTRLVAAVAGDRTALTVAVDPAAGDVPAGLGDGRGTTIRLSRSFRVSPPGVLVRCGHPSVEAEAVAGELLAAHDDGVPWPAMAVVVRHLGRRARSIGRALARHGIPVVPVPALAVEEPVVRAVADMLRWADGDEQALDRLVASPLAELDAVDVRAVRRAALASGQPLESDPRLAPLVALRDHLRLRQSAGDTPADLAYEIWAGRLTSVGKTRLGAIDDRALDALVAFVDGLAAYGGRHRAPTIAGALAAVEEGALEPEPWRAQASAGPDGVTLTSIREAAGREWHTVVVAGCVEGELPRPPARTPVFDPALLGIEPGTLATERRLFGQATSRTTGRLVATAAPEPGVLLSRFVEAWPQSSPQLALAPGQRPPARAATAGTGPISTDGRLTLSASQLDTYDDCPLRYAYQYVLRAREEPGIHANLGSLVHRALARFLSPESDVPKTFEGLMAAAGEVWDDGVARYRPQVEEARRDFVAMLTGWWEREGDGLPDVIAVERGFEIEVGPHRLVGAIDRVDRVGDGIRVVDYKTGKKEPSPADVVDDLQLAVYHLAATRDPELAGFGPPAQLELQYLRSMRRYIQPVTDDHAERTEARVLAIAERILAEDFAPAVDANCRTCPFHRLCPLQDAGRQVEVAVAEVTA